MEKITSFTIDHIKLQPGVYVSRKDPAGDQVITTFDIRMSFTLWNIWQQLFSAITVNSARK